MQEWVLSFRVGAGDEVRSLGTVRSAFTHRVIVPVCSYVQVLYINESNVIVMARTFAFKLKLLLKRFNLKVAKINILEKVLGGALSPFSPNHTLHATA